MGKFCYTVLGIGLAGAIVGIHAYMFMEPKTQCKIKKELSETVDELKKAAESLGQYV